MIPASRICDCLYQQVLGIVVAGAYLIEVGFAVRAWKRSIIAETLRMVEAHNNVNANVENSL